MITDNEIRLHGMQSLINTLGEVQAERFISLIKRENFDYTQWQRNLFSELSFDEFTQKIEQHIEQRQF